jgi:hypothetical protein
MENALKLLEAAFNIIVFFAAVTILLMMSRLYNNLLVTTLNKVSESVMISEAEPVSTINYSTKAELIAHLMGPMEYDLEIIDASGRYTVNADGYRPDSIGLYPLQSINYIKSYLYSMDGTISKIIFQYVH